MAKSILDIEINDDAFKRFRDLFSQYNEELKAQPQAWGTVGEEIAAATEGMAALTATVSAQREIYHEEEQALSRQNAEAKKLLDQEREREKTSKRTWDNLKGAAGAIKNGTVELIRWVGIGSIIGGLVGSGGLFGLDAIAQGVSRTRRAALGVGVNPGELQASQVAFGQWIDPRANLEATAGAAGDLGKSWIWRSLGVNPEQNGLDRQEQLFQRARQVTTSTPANMLTQTAARTGLDQVFSMDELRAIRAMTDEDMRTHEVNLRNARKNIDLSNKVAAEWQNLDVTLQTSKLQIEDTFIRALAPLVPMLGDLSKEIAKTISAFLTNPHLKEWIGEFAQGVGTIATTIGSPEFQDKARQFVNNFALVVDGLVAGLRLLGLIPEEAKGGTADAPSLAPNQAQAIAKGARPDQERRLAAWFQGQGFSQAGSAGLIANLEAESNLNPFAQGDKNRAGQFEAYGIGQWHADRQQDYKAFFGHDIKSVSDPVQALKEQLEFVVHELRDSARKGIGDRIAHETSAYAAGYDVSGRYEVAAGAKGPAAEAARRGALAQQVFITISNPAGANVAATVRALPQ
jgi:hypothetical protein